MPSFGRTIPMFRIFSVEKAKEFYVGFLGFTVDWEHRFEDGLPVYMQVSRGDLTLHLTEHHGDCCPGASVFVDMQELDGFHREIVGKGYRFMKPGIEHAPWNAKLMTVVDPFGNRILFNEASDGS